MAQRKPLPDMGIAPITTAGLHYRDATNFGFADATFRPISNAASTDNLVMSHSSVNYDKSGFVQDTNVVFPIDRFKELVAAGTVASLADVHYSFMGAGLEPEAYAASATQVAGLLKKDRVEAVFLTPV